MFGLEIVARDSHHEAISIWEGEGNDVAVREARRDHHQAVLVVKEPERAFFDELLVQDEADAREKLARASSAVGRRSPQLIGIDGNVAKVRRFTDPRERHFLLGQDETHYFVCQLPRAVESVAEAHAALRPEEAEREGTQRQGEWWFIPVNWAEERRLKELISLGEVLTRPNGHIMGPSDERGLWAIESTPHVADELVSNMQPVGGIPRGTEFVRGVVRQSPRHRPLDLGDHRHRVMRNLEIPDEMGAWSGWVD